MLDRFTADGRTAMLLAQDEARQLGHGYIGVEHVLLGLLGEQHGAGGRLLERYGLTLESTRGYLRRGGGSGRDAGAHVLPMMVEGKNVIDGALRQALREGRNSVGTEHLLLALVSDREGVASEYLSS